MITGEHGLIEVIREIRLDNELVGSVYLASDTRQSTDRVKRFLMVAVAILLLSLGVAFGLASRLQLVISDPIVQLGGVAQQVRLQKSYSVRVAVPAATRLDEIGQLTLAFNDMLAEIERRDHDLQRHRDDLEQQVEQRTADLAAAKDAAERIADQNAQLSRHKQMILNGAGDGIFGLDEDGIATFINPSAATMLGWTVEELIGRPLHSILHPPEVQRSAAGCNVCSALLRPSTRTGRAESFRRRDGSSFPVEYTASIVIDPSGKASGVVVTFRDVTEKRAVERMKDEFVSTVSHELRTPLTSIRGALGLLSSGLLGGIEARGKRMLEIAVTNTDRLVRLINDILDLERMESGRVELTRRPAAVGDLMVEAVQTVQAVADDARVKIEFEPLDTVVSVDRDRVVQTLTNLLGNAVKFSSADATVHMGASVADHRLTIWVRDEGRGIPSEKQGTIFERFKQVDASDSREKGGSGLGLAICRSIVNAHGGRIWCESVEGKGSVFTLALPLDAPRRDPAPPKFLEHWKSTDSAS
jgi:PAS domain S-box-containing protein